MTHAALKRLLVASAAHSAQSYHGAVRDDGTKVTWRGAIDHAVDETAYGRDPKTGKFLTIFVDGDGVPLVTFAAVERQIFPRSRDRKKPR
jgi:hypothetical protein